MVLPALFAASLSALAPIALPPPVEPAAAVRAGPLDDTTTPPYSQLAQRFRADWLTPPEGEFESGAGEWRAHLQQSFVHLRVGLFRVRYPARLLDEPGRSRQLQDLCRELLGLQDRFVHWAGARRVRSRRGATPDIDVLYQWMRGWKPRQLIPGADPTRPRELGTLLEADPGVLEATQLFGASMLSGDFLGLTLEATEPLELVFAPTRGEFLGLACLAGELMEPARGTLWTPGLPQWTVFQWEQTQVLALEYGSAAATLSEADPGTAMDAREKTGLMQHVVHHAAMRMFAHYFDQSLDPAVESGLATHMTIELLGEDNARVGGSKSGNRTSGRSKFVAGGRPQGGKFPRINADSHWRGTKGKDHFRSALRRGQEQGLKAAVEEDREARRTPEGWVLLRSGQDSARSLAVRAPFLGDAPGTADLPEEYLGDGLEFFRAYGASFVEWLRRQKTRESAEQSFAELLRRCASTRTEPGSFAQHVQEVYGVPLTGADRKDDNLEWRFLEGLARR